MPSTDGTVHRRWDPLANLCMANLLCYYCFYLSHVLYVEGTVSFLAPQFKDFALVSSIFSVALGLLARPFGGLFFGLEADSKNLRLSYYKSTRLLAFATLALAFLPPYSYLGVFSSIINMALRMTQGFALGGAYTCAALLAYQLAPEKMQGRYTSFIQVSAPTGFLSALSVVLISKIFFGETTFVNWGWRTTFAFALFLIYFSKKILHQSQFLPAHQHPEKTRWQILCEILGFFRHDKTYLRAFLMFVLPTFSAICVAIYIGHSYQLYFMQSLLKIEPTRAKFILAVCSFLFLPSIVVFGHLADQVGTKKVVLVGIILSTIALIPFFRLNYYFGTSFNDELSALSTNTLGLIVGCWLISIITVMPYSPLIAWAARLFPTQYRTTLFACCHGVGFGILATVAQLAGTHFHATGSTPFAAIYFTVGLNIIALMAWLFAKPPKIKIEK